MAEPERWRFRLKPWHQVVHAGLVCLACPEAEPMDAPVPEHRRYRYMGRERSDSALSDFLFQHRNCGFNADDYVGWRDGDGDSGQTAEA